MYIADIRCSKCFLFFHIQSNSISYSNLKIVSNASRVHRPANENNTILASLSYPLANHDLEISPEEHDII